MTLLFVKFEDVLILGEIILKQLRKNFFAIILIALFGFLSYPTFSEAKFSIIEKDHKKGLVNEKGEVVIPAEHDDLGWSKGIPVVIENVIGFKRNGKWGLLNTKNQKIIDSEYVDLYPFQENTLICSRVYFGSSSPQFGLINTKGKLLIEFKYNHIEKYDARLIVRKNERNKIRYGLMNQEGEVFIPFEYKRINPLGQSLFAVSKDLFSYEVFDGNGKKLINEKYDSVGTFQDGYARIYKNGMQGVIDPAGKVVVEPVYQKINIKPDGSISGKLYPEWIIFDDKNQSRGSFHYESVIPFKEYIYKVKLGEIQALVDISNQNISNFKDYNFLQLTDTLISYEYMGRQGVMSTNGTSVLEPVFDSVYLDLSNIYTYQRADNEKGWVLRNADGTIISNETYDDIKRLNDKFFKVKKSGYWGLINKNGKEEILCKYDSIEKDFEGRFKVHFYGDNGVLSSSGTWIILPQKQEIDLLPGGKYLSRSFHGSEVNSFEGGNIFTKKYLLYPFGEAFLQKDLDFKVGLFDNRGYRICPTIYDEILPLQEDSIYVARKDSAYSFITKGGITLNYLDARFEEVFPMHEDFIGVKIDGKYGFVDPNGDLRIANRYEAIGSFNNGLAPVKILGKWGFVNKAEQIIIQPRYEDVTCHPEGLFTVIQDGKYGIVNNEGNAVVRPEFDLIEKLESGTYAAHQNENIGLFSKYGKILILPRFDSIKDLGNGFIVVSRKGKYGLLTTEGLNIIPMIYDAIVYDKLNDLYLVKKDTQWKDLL